MCRFLAVACVSLGILVPTVGNAQVYQRPTDPPRVTAAGTNWQANGEAVFFAGDFYYPTGPSVYFDGYTMVRSGTYKGVPLFVDATLEPYSMVYVPIGGNVMRPYERLRAGELVGTVGSRMPSFPIERDSDVAVSTRETGLELPVRGEVEPEVVPEALGRSGAVAIPRGGPQPTDVQPDLRPRGVESIPPPQSNDGIWVTFDGTRWYASGPAVPFIAQRLDRVGEIDGFPVYRDQIADASRAVIYIPAVQDGPLARYERR